MYFLRTPGKWWERRKGCQVRRRPARQKLETKEKRTERKEARRMQHVAEVELHARDVALAGDESVSL